jgi:hypothetical protein
MNRREFIYGATVAAAHARAHASMANHLQRKPLMPGDLQERTLLLVDEYHILYRSGTRRKLNPLRKFEGNPVLPARVKPWEVEIGWNSSYRDPNTGIYKLWYQAYSGKKAHERTKECVVCYAESMDGIHWNRPSLNLFSYNSIQDTNIVLIGNGGHSTNYGASVIVTPEDPDKARLYKMAYCDWSVSNGQEYPGLSVAFSADGIHWRKYPKAPLLRASYGSPGEPLPYENESDRPWSVPLAISDALFALYDPNQKMYEIYSKMWIDGPDGGMYWKHVMGRTQSEDFIHWSKPEIVLAPDDCDPPWLEFHASPVFYYNGCYFALLQRLHRDIGGGVIDIELATSRDGIHWERPFRHDLFLKRSQGDHFDSGSVFLDPTPIYLEKEFRFHYAGYSGGATGGDDSKIVSGIGLATMERDRFAGIEPLDHIGQITLKPLDLRGIANCSVNADASRGAVRVEVLGEDERRIRGFTRDDATPLQGDQLELSPRWNGRTLADLQPGQYSLRLHLENATVFAINLHS